MNPQNKKILDNAYQMPIYGGEIYNGQDFYLRFYVNNHMFFKSIYIPFGPVIKNKSGIKEFQEFVSNLKLCKFKIDLPLMLDKAIINEFKTFFESRNFKRTDYIHDNETLLITKETFKINSRNQRYVRSSLKKYTIEIYDSLDQKLSESIYKIYSESASRVGYTPKSQDIIEQVASKGLTAVGRDNETGNIEGFLIGYLNKSLVNNILENISSKPQVLQLIFTGISEKGMQSKLGFGVHHELFVKSFNDYAIEVIDFHGASRSQNRTYTAFKQSFGGIFIEMPGSYEKLIII